MPKVAFGCAMLVLLATGSARAQYRAVDPRDVGAEEEEFDRPGIAGPVSFNLGGALSLPVSDAGSRFDTGVGFVAGVAFMPPRSVVGARAEYMFSHYDVEGDVLAAAGIDEASGLDGRQYMQAGTLNVVVRPPEQRRFGFYVIGGGGIYYRNVELTEFAGVGTTTFCDPMFFACYPEAVPVDRVLDTEDSWDFGVNGGLGAFAVLTPPFRLYLEARYHYMWGPEFTAPNGNRVDSDGQYIPVVLGLTF